MTEEPGGNREGLGVLVGAAAVAVCCALPLLAVAGAATAGVAGLAAWWWPLAVVVMALGGWAAVTLTRTVLAGRRDRQAGRPGQRRP